MFGWWNIPIVRNYRNGLPLTETVRLVNRSEQIRRIFAQFGNVGNITVINHLARSGLEVHDSTIRKIRRRLIADKLLKP